MSCHITVWQLLDNKIYTHGRNIPVCSEQMFKHVSQHIKHNSEYCINIRDVGICYTIVSHTKHYICLFLHMKIKQISIFTHFIHFINKLMLSTVWVDRVTLVILPLECVCGRPDYTRCHWSCSLIRLCPTLSCSLIHCCSLMLRYRRKEETKKERKRTFLLVMHYNIK